MTRPLLAFAFVALLATCRRDPQSVKFDQYFVQGQSLYEKHCSNCHQKSGDGLALLFPPLKGSDYLMQNFDAVLCQMKYGRDGEVIVNGKSFNKKMPGIPSLTELEIAEIATFIGNEWGNKKGLTEVSTVHQALEKCSP